MSETLRVYIGDGSHLDGGPFFGDEVLWHDEETMHVGDDEPEGRCMEIGRYEVHNLVDEINSGQPARIGAVPKEESFMGVKIECHDGIVFETNGMVSSGGQLAQSGDLRRRFARSFRNHGGEVSENNP